MKLAYNISLPVAHTALAFLLLTTGFSRFLAWSAWSWGNDLLYFGFAALVLGSHQFLLRWGRKNDMLFPMVIRTLGAVDYILFSIQLVAMLACLLWEVAAPLLREDRTFSPIALWVTLPIIAVDIVAMALRSRSSKKLLSADA